MSPEQEWTPTLREQHLIFWMRKVMRYGVGGGGLCWAMLTRNLDPVLIFVLGAVATSTDILKFGADLWRSARAEEKQEVHERTAARREEGSER